MLGPTGSFHHDDDWLLGIACWNAGQFSEAADHFESVWVGEVGTRRECLRGLIHAAMGLHYALAGDEDAARSKLATAARLLAPFPADFLGLDVDGLRSGVGALRAGVDAIKDSGRSPGSLSELRLPRLLSLPAGSRHGGC